MELESTYLAWIDIRATGLSSDEITRLLLEKEHLMINSGTMYGGDGEGFIRINIACPRSVLQDALLRIKRLLKNEL